MLNPRYRPLLVPLTFPNGLQTRNRIAVAPMTHYSSLADGHSNPEEIPYTLRRAKDVGLFITAAYAISAEGKGYQGEPSIAEDRFLPDLRKIADAIQSQGALAIIQLHHGGGVCPPELVPNGDVVSPSGIATPERSSVTPRELTSQEIEEIILAYGKATHRAIQAGFDGVELHGAFGYLLQQFLSPYTNQRTDDWGERHAFPLAVIKETQRVVQTYANRPFLVGYRLTPEEALQPGLTMADALSFTEALVKSGVDFIDILVNSYDSKPRAGVEDKSESRLTLLSRQVAGRCVLMGGGAIFSAEEGLEAYQSGLDMITLAREMIMDPEWVEKISRGEEDQIVTVLAEDQREALDIPKPFWQVIWSAPGWFPGTLK